MGKVECVKTGERRTDLKWDYGRRKPKKADGTSTRVAVSEGSGNAYRSFGTSGISRTVRKGEDTVVERR
jgi:hypothetical protein